MIEVNSLSKDFKIINKYEGFGGAIKSFLNPKYTVVKAVNDVSFYVDKGEIVGFIGLNGAGKSTTIKMLSGLLVPTKGECKVNNIIPYKERIKHTKNIGVIFGNRSQLWWDLPVCDSFTVLKKIYEIPEKNYQERLAYLVDILEIKDFYTTPVRNLSLGQKMRADFAASLLHNPSTLFFDEPTIGLDIIVKEKIRKAIKEINKEFNTTIMLTTHDIDDIEQVCNKIIVIDKGSKIYDGSLEDLKKNYGKTRSVIFDISGESDKDKLLQYYNNEQDINVSMIETGRIRIDFDKSIVNLPVLMKELVSNYEVKDFTVVETRLEDIVKEIYSK